MIEVPLYLVLGSAPPASGFWSLQTRHKNMVSNEALSSSVSAKSGSSFAFQNSIPLNKSMKFCREIREYNAPGLSEK